jgi:hypothetical protein
MSLAFAPPAKSAAKAASAAVVSNIRALVISYMTFVLLDRSTMA